MGVKTSLILGGSGLIGKELHKRLILNGEQAVNLDIKEGTDLRTSSLEKYADVDYVWFLAWDSGGAKYLANEKNFLNIYKNNLQLCNAIFSFIEKYNKPFLFTSSQLAASDTPYGISKLLGEEWGKLLGGKIVRLWNVYGWEAPDERSHVIPDLIIQALTNKKIELMTSGEERRQFIFVEDCVQNLIRIRELNGNTFSLTNGKWLMIKEVAATIASALKIEVALGKDKGYEHLIEPTDLVKNKFVFNYPLEDGINKIINSANLYLQNKS
jgi:nucleoside-diphosphate-sugar epimerase